MDRDMPSMGIGPQPQTIVAGAWGHLSQKTPLDFSLALLSEEYLVRAANALPEERHVFETERRRHAPKMIHLEEK